MSVTKLYCFVDETGQDTKGKIFLVSIVINEASSIADLEQELISLEKKTSKNKSKWKKTHKLIKVEYIKQLLTIKSLRHTIYYSTYLDSKEYSKLTSLTIAKAVLASNQEQYKVSVIIDGLNNHEREVVRSELKKLKIKYSKIRGMKDEQSVFLRLADAMAGFLRDMLEKQKYAIEFRDELTKSGIIIEA